MTFTMQTTKRFFEAIVASRWTAISLCVLAVATIVDAQAPKTTLPRSAFDVVSIKYSGTIQDHMIRTANDFVGNARSLEYNGKRLSCDTNFEEIIKFAFSSLLVPYRDEMPIEIRRRYYQIDAIAPEGTTLDGSRAMLATTLVERLGLRYHIAEQETPVFFLLRDSGQLKLVRSTESVPPGPTRHDQWRLRTKWASVSDLAKFLSAGMRREVVDRTGIQGYYQFDLDWTAEVMKEGIDNSGPSLALADAKRLGLKLESGKEARKILVVDHINEKPTPN